MSRLIFAILAAAVLIPLPVQAQESAWRPAVRQCAEIIDREQHCTTACDNALWPSYVSCAIGKLRLNIPADRIEACARRVSEQRKAQRACELCGDPAQSFFTCLNAK
jgi:hypothetical protein